MADSRLHRIAGWMAALAVIALAGCGGSGGMATTAPTPPPPPPPPPPSGPSPSLAVRKAAIEATVVSNARCASIGSIYWEVGDSSGALDSGRVDKSGPSVLGTTRMPIASASKWLYSTYYVQRANGNLSSDDIKFLNFRSGHTNLAEPPGCDNTQNETVSSCLAHTNSNGTNFGAHDPSTDGFFFYNGGHMQVHATNLGLGTLNNAGLAAELKKQLGDDVDISYTQPQLAGGVFTAPQEYAKVLRKIVAGTLLMNGKLGTSPVCTNTDLVNACPTAKNTPSPSGEQWHYAVGHWVEDDPIVGDGAFSSPGAFGFYPWIDKTKTYYGIVAQADPVGAYQSIFCGRLLRNAWVTGLQQSGPNPTLR